MMTDLENKLQPCNVISYAWFSLERRELRPEGKQSREDYKECKSGRPDADPSKSRVGATPRARFYPFSFLFFFLPLAFHGERVCTEQTRLSVVTFLCGQGVHRTYLRLVRQSLGRTIKVMLVRAFSEAMRWGRPVPVQVPVKEVKYW